MCYFGFRRAAEQQSSRGKNYLPTIFLLLLTIIISPQITMGQIMYNKVKPYSYQSEELLPVNQLPTLEYNVSSDGNLSIDNLIVNVKEKALLEKKGDKYVSRFKFKINARKLGEISIFFKDVKLANGTTCYVYTTDYQIVAGPITQKSINANYLTIMKLPADELVIELVTDKMDGYDIKLNEISYFSLFKKKEVQTEELQSEIVRNYDCNYGEVKYFEQTQLPLTDYLNYQCEEFGYEVGVNYFNTQYIRSINDYQYNASRASCIIFRPLSLGDKYYDKRNYIGENGTLINFPYSGCGGEDECGVGIVVGIYHNGGAEKIVNATTNNNQAYLDKILFRFNSHHKYGTPWHLDSNIYYCTASESNFHKWRETIDWDEVIDYCGATLFLYGVDGLGADVYILKMKQKPFYKEHHLGWSTQKNLFDSTNIFNAIGRKGALPTSIIYSSNSSVNSLRIKGLNVATARGFSGSIFTVNDYHNSDERISIGMLKTGIQDGNAVFVSPRLFSSTFNDYDNISFFPSCNSSFTKINDYLSQTKFNNIVNDNQSPLYKWMPSIENKEKCQSNVGYNLVTHFYEPCTIDTSGMFTTVNNENGLCFTISGFQANSFPNNSLPFGYRIYHNFGDQKTIKFDSFITSDDDITFPYTVCISKCDMLYLLSLGRDRIDIAVDFYDSNGRILNNNGCSNFHFETDIPLSICDMFDFSIKKVDSSQSIWGRCTYRIGIKIIGCDEDNPMTYNILNSLKYKYSTFPVFLVKNIPGVNIDFANDSMSFDFEISNPELKFILDGNNICELDSIDFPLCSCNCNHPDEVMQSWVDMNINYGGEGNDCPEYMCKVSAGFNIPTFYDSFTHYAVEDSLQIIPLQPDGSINYEFRCIYKGLSQKFKIYLYKNAGDIYPCVIEKTAYCPLPEYPVESCVPDCEDEPFRQPPLIKEVDLYGCPGCKAIVEYTFRTSTCNGSDRQDLQVLSFKLQSDDPLLCSNCGLSPSQIYTQAIHAIILENRMGFKPTSSGLCDTTWRVIQSTCWAEGFWFPPIEMPVSMPRWVACDGAGCCIKDIIVCRSTIGITVIPVGGSAETDACGNYIRTWYAMSYDISTDEWNYGLDTAYCEDKCDWLNALQVFDYTEKQVVINENDSSLALGENFSSGIKEYPDYIDVQILSKLSGSNVKISIVNLYGNELNSTKSRLKSGYNNYILNTNELNTGMYYVYISVNGTLQSGKKFIIIR